MIVSYLVVRTLIVQHELGERRRNGMIVIQEYDLELKPTNIIHGQGLCKLIVES